MADPGTPHDTAELLWGDDETATGPVARDGDDAEVCGALYVLRLAGARHDAAAVPPEIQR